MRPLRPQEEAEIKIAIGHLEMHGPRLLNLNPLWFERVRSDFYLERLRWKDFAVLHRIYELHCSNKKGQST